MGKASEDELEWESLERGETSFKRQRLGGAAGGEQLGCSLYEVPPGRKSWPFHYHTRNEEALYVLEGAGTLRTADDRQPLEAGDYVALPTGEDGAHRVINDSEEPLRFLMLSTMADPEVTVYPDSDKFGVFVGGPPGGEGERSLHGYYRREDSVDYWTGEESE